MRTPNNLFETICEMWIYEYKYGFATSLFKPKNENYLRVLIKLCSFNHLSPGFPRSFKSLSASMTSKNASGCSEPRFPGLGQDNARPKSIYTVKMLAKAKAGSDRIRAHD
jgi:hypothetical protein